jgi:hypothetical protein
MQSTFESACAYGALSTLTCVLFFWNAELLPGFDLGRALCAVHHQVRFITSIFGSACVRALSTLTGVLCFWDAELPPGFNLGALC